jgi:hypothetical protein
MLGLTRWSGERTGRPRRLNARVRGTSRASRDFANEAGLKRSARQAPILQIKRVLRRKPPRNLAAVSRSGLTTYLGRLLNLSATGYSGTATARRTTLVAPPAQQSRRLRRIENARTRPEVTILVDHYDEDWTSLCGSASVGVLVFSTKARSESTHSSCSSTSTRNTGPSRPTVAYSQST